MAKIYYYTCPECRRRYELRRRTTMTRRRCPHCGYEVTADEIDAQESARWWGRQFVRCLSTLIVMALLAACCTGVGVFAVWKMGQVPSQTSPKTKHE